MDELKEIREALNQLDSWRQEGALAALERLESRKAKKTVPMAMLEEIAISSWAGDIPLDDAEIKAIAADHGYEVAE